MFGVVAKQMPKTVCGAPTHRCQFVGYIGSPSSHALKEIVVAWKYNISLTNHRAAVRNQFRSTSFSFRTFPEAYFPSHVLWIALLRYSTLQCNYRQVSNCPLSTAIFPHISALYSTLRESRQPSEVLLSWLLTVSSTCKLTHPSVMYSLPGAHLYTALEYDAICKHKPVERTL